MELKAVAAARHQLRLQNRELGKSLCSVPEHRRAQGSGDFGARLKSWVKRCGVDSGINPLKYAAARFAGTSLDRLATFGIIIGGSQRRNYAHDAEETSLAPERCSAKNRPFREFKPGPRFRGAR